MVWSIAFSRYSALATLSVAGLMLFGAETSVLADDAEINIKLTDQRDYIAANEALSDGLYEVAAVKLERLLTLQKWAKKDRLALTSLTAEAWVRGNRAEEALSFITGHDFPDAAFWRGQALLQKGDFVEAENAFISYPATGQLASYALLGASHAFLGQDRESTARSRCKVLRGDSREDVARYARLLFNELELGGDRTQTVLDRLNKEKESKDSSVAYLVARSLTERGELPQAESQLRHILAQKGVGEKMHDASTVLLAEVLWRQNKSEGLALLLTLLNSLTQESVDHRTEMAYWVEAFDLLSRISASTKSDPKLISAAVAWLSPMVSTECRGHALYFLATEMQRLKRDEEAIGLLEALIQMLPEHARRSAALRLAMRLHGEAHSDDRVLNLAERWRLDFGSGDQSVVNFLVGMIRFTRGEYEEALALFLKAAAVETDFTTHRRALYNAAICAIQAGEKVALASLLTQLAVPPVSEPTTPGTKARPINDDSADVLLDQALALAAKGDLSAEISLGTFVKDHPQHPRCPEAQIALAEIALLDVPPRVKPAAEALNAAASTLNLAPNLAERIGYVRVWMREAEGELAWVTREGTEFLKRWPHSERAPEVRMKVGEAYYRLEDYPNARTQFELLDKEQPDSPFADAALFFAGMAAMNLTSTEGLNTAIDRWDELAERGGPLAFAARQHQALAKRRLGQEVEALGMIEALLALPEATGEAKLSLLTEKAELLLLLGKRDPKSTEAAVNVLTDALKDKALPFLWAARLGYMKSSALKELGRIGESLEACYDVVSVGSNQLTAPTTPAEFRWYYSAGFLAVDLLEQTQQWDAAARIAEKLASTNGTRAAEAKQRATDIRLEHFLWDDNSK